MKQRMLVGWLAALLAAGTLGNAHAALRLNELYVDPEDRLAPNDEGFGREFFEIISDAPNESLAGVWFLEIDGQALNRGIVRQAIDLSAYSTGANGLFLWRDNDDILVPNPHPDTVIGVGPFVGSRGLLTSGSATFMLVTDFTGAINDDLDTDLDGVLDAPLPFSGVLDALGIARNTATAVSYAGAFGGVDFENTSFGPDAYARLPNSGPYAGMWFAFDTPDGDEDPNYYGPFYARDALDNVLEDGTNVPMHIAHQFFLTPGSANQSFVPEPASASLALLGMLGALGIRRRGC